MESSNDIYFVDLDTLSIIEGVIRRLSGNPTIPKNEAQILKDVIDTRLISASSRVFAENLALREDNTRLRTLLGRQRESDYREQFV